MVSGKKIGTPKLTLTKEQMNALNEFADEIEKIDLRPLPRKRLWRDHHYMGGVNGVISDTELSKLNLPKEIETMQRFMNLLVDIKFLSVEPLEVTGTYSRATFESVKSLQTKLNEFLAEKKKGVYVPPSGEEKRVISAVITKIAKSEESLEGSIFNAPEGKEFETKMGKFTYKVRMGMKAVEGKNRVGFVEVFDEEGNRLKKVAITVDRKGKVNVEGTMLYQILVDGYIGVETLRAMTAYLKDKTTLEKELPMPKPIHLSMKVGYSFVPYLISNWPYEKEALIYILGNKTVEKNSKLMNIINLTLWNMSYEAEKSLRENPLVIEVEGKKYSATWQGLRKAYLEDDVEPEVFLKAWINALKKNPLLKELVEKAERGELKEPKSAVSFSIIGETKGALNVQAVGVDLSDVSTLFGRAIDNIKHTFKESSYREEMISEVRRLQAFVEEETMKILHKIEKKGKGKEESEIREMFVKELNNNTLLKNTIFVMYNYFAEIPGTLSYIKLDITYTALSNKEEMRAKLKEFIDAQLNKNRELVVKTFEKENMYNENSIRMAEKFIDRYCKYVGGKVFIDLHRIKSDEMKSFVHLFRWNLYVQNIKDVEARQKEQQQEKRALLQSN